MDLDVVDGSLTWTPTADQAGEHPVEIEVADIHGGKTTQSFVVTVGFEDEKAADAQAPAQKAPAPPAATD